jgi:hypothetical protein
MRRETKLAAQANYETGTEEKRESSAMEQECSRSSYRHLVAPIPERRVSFVMTPVQQWHPTFKPIGSTKGILTRNWTS